MTPSYLRAGFLGLLFAATAAAQTPPTADKPAGPRPVVLLLDNYSLVRGRFALDAAGDYARADGDKAVVPAKRVLFVGTSAPEVQAFLAARAKELAAKPVPLVAGHNPVAAYTFAGKIQPLLTNLCAGCHARPDYPGDFKLASIPPGHFDDAAVRANLVTTARTLNRADPSASDLLTKAVTAHGGRKAAPLPRRSHPAFETLALWAHGMALPDGSPLPTALPGPKLVQPPAVFAIKPRVAVVKPAATPKPPADPFDPAEFNRKK